MERAPVAQMSNGSPYVEPNIPQSNKTAIEMADENGNKYAADAVTMWVTTTSVQIQTSIITSLVVSLSTITQISTIIATAPTTTSIPGIGNQSPAASSQLSSTTAGAIGPPLTSSAILNQTSTSAADLTTPTSMTRSLLGGNSSITASQLISATTSSTNLIPTSSESDSAALIHRVSNHESLIKTMAVLVSGIFLITALLAAGLYFLRRKEEKASEIEAANTAQRQEQPLMTEPIVPYSSAYGSNLQN